MLRDAGGALSAQEISDRILAEGLWQTSGKTPHATVAAQLYTDIKKRGDASAFIQVGKNMFGLRDGAGVPEPIKPKPKKAVPAKPSMTGKCSFTDAAEKVLEQFGAKKPMHYREVTEKALELDWIATEGKTPEATMYAQVLTEIRRYQKRGEQPRFVQHGRGFMGLTKWMGKGLEFQINQHNKRIRKELHKRLHAMDATEFEQFVGHRLLADLGFEDIEVTKRCKDGGIDVRGTLVVEEVIRIPMTVRLQHRVQHAQHLVDLLRPRNLRPAIPRRRGVFEHLLQRLPVNPERRASRPLAAMLDQNVSSHLRLQIHVCVHLGCVLRSGKENERSRSAHYRPKPKTGQGAALLRRPSAPRPALHFLAAVHIHVVQKITCSLATTRQYRSALNPILT